jgi:hypothetical protein
MPRGSAAPIAGPCNSLVPIGGTTAPSAAVATRLHRHDNWRSQIVHEAVRAAFGLRKQQPPNEIDEAAAYLGETVWFRAGGPGRVVGANDTLRDAAGKV